MDRKEDEKDEKNRERERQIQDTVTEIHVKRNALPNRIGDVKGKSKEFADWLVDLDSQMQIDINIFKHTKPHRKYHFPQKRTIKVPQEEDEYSIPINNYNRSKRDNDMNKREDSMIENDRETANKAKAKNKKNKNRKRTYPVCMEYYEPFNIAIFGLVSKEI